MTMAGNKSAASRNDDAMPLRIEREGNLAIWTLARPAKANALNPDMIKALCDALYDAETDASIRGVLLLGAGRNFCAGADLTALATGAHTVRPVMDGLRELFRRFEKSRLAIVAGVQGAARAGGLELALACDAVVATRSATFGDAHLANGLLPAGGSTARLPRTIGWQRAKWLVLSASTISSETAAQWGLVTELCDSDKLGAATRRIARALVAADAATFREAKSLFGTLADRSFEEALEAEITTLERHARSDEFRVGISRFFARATKGT